ncbi:MAG: hypothetical protein CMF59_16125 [Leptospiraceae bacterium]|nr:hypothetical protein [Leptospiraceae bacterium]
MSFTTEEMRNLRKFKKAILDVLFIHCETFYIHCMPHEQLVLGKRGLLKKEQTEGLILVFGPYSTRKLTWDDDSLECEMQFSRWEYVRIPFDSIVRMFDKSGQVIMQWAMPELEEVTGPDLKLHVTDSDADAQETEGAGSSGDNEADSSEKARPAGKSAARRATKKSSKKSRKSTDDNVIEVDFTQKKKP